jgi:hypothetical protein
MHASVTRRTIRFGGINLAGSVVYCGIPGPATDGGAVAASGDAARLTTSTYLPVNTSEQSSSRIDLLGGGGPITAIGIAPDSAIHTCDVALYGRSGELERHRISPGNPLLGCRDDADFANISIPNAIPGVGGSSEEVAWDATVQPGSGVMGFPLRLEVWRGGLLPIRSPKRAGYFSHALFEFAAGAGDRSLLICVDGRRRVDVVANSLGGTSTLTCNAWETIKAAGAPTLDGILSVPLELTSAGVLSLAIGSGKIISFDGNPMSILEVNVAQTVAAGVVQIKVKAWD